MAYGKIKADTLTWDNGGTDVDITISTIPDAADLAAKANTADIGVTIQPYDANLPAGNDILVATDLGVVVQQHDADTAKTDVVQTFTAAQRGDIVDVTGTTPNFDLNAGNNFRFTTSGNWTSFTVSNLAAATEGQTGSIFIVYGGADTGSFAPEFKFVGGAAGITLTSTASAVDRIDYIVLNSTTITCNFTANYVA